MPKERHRCGQNVFHSNYYERCDKAQHFDNRGMGWQNYGCNCSGPVATSSPCNPAAALAVVSDPANKVTRATFLPRTVFAAALF